jgi:hypothetical protein
MKAFKSFTQKWHLTLLLRSHSLAKKSTGVSLQGLEVSSSLRDRPGLELQYYGDKPVYWSPP